MQIVRRLHLLLDLLEDGNFIFAHYHTLELILRHLRVPRMRLDVMYFVALLGVDLHDMLHEVLRLLLDIARYQILAGENFLVQLVRVCVLKRQVTYRHRVENDA